KILSVNATALSFPAVLRLLDVCPIILKLFVGVVAHAVCTAEKVPAAANDPNSNEFAAEGVTPPVVNVVPLPVRLLKVAGVSVVAEYSVTTAQYAIVNASSVATVTVVAPPALILKR